MRQLVERRGAGYDSVRDLWLRSGLETATLERLADADAFRSLGLDRREALWAVRGLDRVGDQDALPLFALSRPARDAEPDAKLPPMPLGAHVVEDYRRLSLSLKAHPVAFMRARLDARGVKRSDALASLKSGERVAVAGLVLVRQRPGTAQGVIFMTLEDEAGVANLIVWPKAFERLRADRHRRALRRRDGQAAERIRRRPSHRRAHGGSDADARPAVARRRLSSNAPASPKAPPPILAAPPGRPLRSDPALLRSTPAADRRAARSGARPAGGEELSLKQPDHPRKRGEGTNGAVATRHPPPQARACRRRSSP